MRGPWLIVSCWLLITAAVTAQGGGVKDPQEKLEAAQAKLKELGSDEKDAPWRAAVKNRIKLLGEYNATKKSEDELPAAESIKSRRTKVGDDLAKQKELPAVEKIELNKPEGLKEYQGKFDAAQATLNGRVQALESLRDEHASRVQLQTQRKVVHNVQAEQITQVRGHGRLTDSLRVGFAWDQNLVDVARIRRSGGRVGSFEGIRHRGEISVQQDYVNGSRIQAADRADRSSRA